jgi:hypothetical protein
MHGSVVSIADLNGFEYGSEVRHPDQGWFERKPDAVVANGAQAGLRAAYAVAMGRLDEMEPTSQESVRPRVEAKVRRAGG